MMAAEQLLVRENIIIINLHAIWCFNLFVELKFNLENKI